MIGVDSTGTPLLLRERAEPEAEKQKARVAPGLLRLDRLKRP
jgi:hypothetical protein